jgi:hypothetical protein
MEPAHIFAPGHTWPDVVLRAIEALIVIVPVLLSWDNRRRHREAILNRDLSPDQLRALAAPKPMPTPGATAAGWACDQAHGHDRARAWGTRRIADACAAWDASAGPVAT